MRERKRKRERGREGEVCLYRTVCKSTVVSEDLNAREV